ncbi:MAG: SMP-30/gluconolactonase/LRE family protein [Lentisphaeraceae bacterium]|nr:SMP-30/gluconolactonase/LRE family protein [Lentisphaeraceae bacterium]
MLKLPSLFIALSALFVSCQTTPIEFTPEEQCSIVPKDSKLEKLWGEGVFTEGPTPDAEGNILFTNIRVNKIHKYNIKTGKTSVYRENSNGANGLHFQNGKLFSCEGAGLLFASVAVTEKDGKKKILSSSYKGKKLNSPNDLVVTSKNHIYFTDPRYGSMKGKELDFEGVFLIKDGKTILATKETERPNGILISADEKTLFVADNNNRPNGAMDLMKFDIQADGTLINKEILYSFPKGQRGIDGMAMDSEGNIYATAGLKDKSGIYVFSQEGEHLAFIQLPGMPTNCSFGGPTEKDVLYITCKTDHIGSKTKKFGLYRIKLNKRAK